MEKKMVKFDLMQLFFFVSTWFDKKQSTPLASIFRKLRLILMAE